MPHQIPNVENSSQPSKKTMASRILMLHFLIASLAFTAHGAPLPRPNNSTRRIKVIADLPLLLSYEDFTKPAPGISAPTSTFPAAPTASHNVLRVQIVPSAGIAEEALL